MLGAIDPVNINWNSWGANGTVSKLLGRHTLKFGVDYRLIGLDFQSFDNGAGEFRFDRRFTSLEPDANGRRRHRGTPSRASCSGYPSGDPGNISTPRRLDAARAVHALLRRLRAGRLPRQLEAHAELRPAAGARDRSGGEERPHHRGLRSHAQSRRRARQRLIRQRPAHRRRARLRGRERRQRLSGRSAGLKVSPRLGVVYSINPKTVLRAGYGLYWAPWNYQAPNNTNYGQIGSSQVTQMQPGPFRPDGHAEQPVPERPAAAGRQRARRADRRRRRRSTSSIRTRTRRRSTCIPWTSTASCRATSPSASSMPARRAATSASADRTTASSTSTRCRTRTCRSAPALNEQVPNPFFGLPAGQGFNVTSPTVPRSQLLRPFPQFGNILMRQSTLGENQYHAAIFKFEKRVSNGWGGRINYTWSQLKDNQFGEGNFFSRNSDRSCRTPTTSTRSTASASSTCRTRSSSRRSSSCRSARANGGRTSGVGAAILGDWVVSSIIAFESGFPISLYAQLERSERLRRAHAARQPRLGRARNRRHPQRPHYAAGRLRVPHRAIAERHLAEQRRGHRPGRLGARHRAAQPRRRPHAAPQQLGLRGQQGCSPAGRCAARSSSKSSNLTNTPKVRGPIRTVGSSTFGQIRVSQASCG